MFNLKDLKRNITLVPSSAFCATTKILFALPFVTQTLSSCTSFLIFFIRYFFVRHSRSSTWYHLQFFTQRSNQFSLKNVSCWFGSDYVKYVIPARPFFNVPTTFKNDTCWSFLSVPTTIIVIRFGQLTFVPTTTKVIRVGKNIYPFQPLEK